jgi:hypothetical protein
MKITLKEAHSIVYQQITHQITVDIDGTEYIIRHAEDDNGSEYYVSSPNLNNGYFMNLYEMEDGELKELIEKLANAAYDDYIFGESKVGKEVDMETLEDY